MRERACQAPSHESTCPCQVCQRSDCKGCRLATNDHFQPKCIAKIWHLNFNREGNIQSLSKPCHIQKDHDTALRAEVLKFQLDGGKLTFEQHRQLFERDK